MTPTVRVLIFAGIALALVAALAMITLGGRSDTPPRVVPLPTFDDPTPENSCDEVTGLTATGEPANINNFVIRGRATCQPDNLNIWALYLRGNSFYKLWKEPIRLRADGSFEITTQPHDIPAGQGMVAAVQFFEVPSDRDPLASAHDQFAVSDLPDTARLLYNVMLVS